MISTYHFIPICEVNCEMRFYRTYCTYIIQTTMCLDNLSFCVVQQSSRAFFILGLRICTLKVILSNFPYYFEKLLPKRPKSVVTFVYSNPILTLSCSISNLISKPHTRCLHDKIVQLYILIQMIFTFSSTPFASVLR